MYFVKLKQKGAKTAGYANWQIILYADQFKGEGYNKDNFILTKEDAERLCSQLINRNGGDIDLEYISIVRSSHPYKPYAEVEVIFYRRFK